MPASMKAEQGQERPAGKLSVWAAAGPASPVCTPGHQGRGGLSFSPQGPAAQAGVEGRDQRGTCGGWGVCSFLAGAGWWDKGSSLHPWHPGSVPCFQGPAQAPHSHVMFLPETLQPLEFLRTSLGGRFLVYESFLYRKEKAAGEKVYWMCRDQARLGCRSRAITQGQRVTVMRSHCHLPDLAGLEALRQRERLPSTAQQEDPGTDRSGGERAVGILVSASPRFRHLRRQALSGDLCSLVFLPFQSSNLPLYWLLLLSLETHLNWSHP